MSSNISNRFSSLASVSGKHAFGAFAMLALVAVSASSSSAAASRSINVEAGGLYVPVSRSELVIAPSDIAEVLVADPSVADVHVIGAKRVVFIGKSLGRTDAKLFDKDNHIIRQFQVVVGYDLPGIRKALHAFLPHEHIGVELVNTNIALVGEVSDASVADKAMVIASQFMTNGIAGGSSSGGASALAPGQGQGSNQASSGGGGSSSALNTGSPSGNGGGNGSSGGSGGGASINPNIINLMKVISGQQVMLRVKVGEIQRNALKQLGFEFAGGTGSGKGGLDFGSNGGQGGFTQAGAYTGLPINPTSLAGGGLLQSYLTNGQHTFLSDALTALETQGLLKTLAEPDLVAMSGERAEFLAGGEFPIPSVQIGSNGAVPVTTVSFQQFGVAVQFVPYVLSDNRIRLVVEPEVSQIDTANETTVNGTVVPGLDTRRAKTTVELSPGESFMIAGLLQDNLNSSINQVPGASELPILGALFRSTSYQRGETELVIAVTPYIVDPLKSSDVRMPYDDFRPASVMEQFFYGALGSMTGNTYRISQTPSLEGPIGFMTE